MSSAISERICGHCHESKPWDEFEQPMLVLQYYRVPWLKKQLLRIEEISQYELEQEGENDKTDEEIAFHKNVLKTARHIRKTIDTQYNRPYHWVEIPVNEYERDWLKGYFSYEKKLKRECLKNASERKDERAILGMNSDLEMINHILKIIDISYMDKCKACADSTRYPQFVLDSWKKHPVIVHIMYLVGKQRKNGGSSSMRRIQTRMEDLSDVSIVAIKNSLFILTAHIQESFIIHHRTPN